MKSEEILKNWNQYFNEGNLSSIVKLYDKECILLPTFSNEIFSDLEKIKGYFFKCIIEQKVSVEINYNSVVEKKIGENIFLLSGVYIFEFKTKKKVTARFTFLINPMKEKPIKHHHSSPIPD